VTLGKTSNSTYIHFKFTIMKRKLLAITMAAIFAACNSNPKAGTQTTTTTTTTADTSGFRNNAFADKGQVIELKGVNDTIVTGDGNRYVKVDPNKPTQPVQNNVASTTPTPSVKVPTATTHRSTSRTTRHTSGHSSSGGYSGSGSSGGGYSGAGTASAPVATKKKGWSKAAKGTAIGAGVGAIGGAIISKKKGLGAVIGGVVGGAGGYIIGHNKDKKDGRY
jgi:hypothetical protein